MTTYGDIINNREEVINMHFDLEAEIERFKKNPTNFTMNLEFLYEKNIFNFIEYFLETFKKTPYTRGLNLIVRFDDTTYTFNTDNILDILEFYDLLNNSVSEGFCDDLEELEITSHTYDNTK